MYELTFWVLKTNKTFTKMYNSEYLARMMCNKCKHSKKIKVISVMVHK